MYYFCSFCKNFFSGYGKIFFRQAFAVVLFALFWFAGDEDFLERAVVKLAVFFQSGGNNGTENDHRPGQIHPDEKNGQSCEGAVEGFVGGCLDHKITESPTQDGEQDDGDKGADDGAADFDLFVGNQDVDKHQKKHRNQRGQEFAEQQLGVGQVFGHEFLRVNR